MTLPALQFLGYYRQDPGTQPGGVQIREGYCVVELVTAGRGWIDNPDGGWDEVVPGDLLWHEGGEWTIRRSDEADPYHCLVVRAQVAAGGTRCLPRRTAWADPAQAMAFAQEALAWQRDPAIPPDILAAAVLGRLVLEGQRWLARGHGGDLPPALLAARDHLNEHFAQPVAIADLADLAGCSTQHLHLLFRRHLGTTPHQWLLDRRLRETKERLLASRKPLAEIAAAAGFTDAATLCRAFRRAMGTSPGTWRLRPW